MFSAARARSSMIFEARNSSRRLTIVTFEANLARKIASSIARVAAADDHRLRLRKNAASQVAQ